MSASIRPNQLIKLLAATIQAKYPVLITGQPGVGKTDIVKFAAKQAGADLIISHPAVSDPTDAKGLPWPGKDGKSATFLPFGELSRAINADKLTVWFLDDFGQAPPAVQASFMQLILSRRINQHRLPSNVVFIAATNRRTDKAGVSGILEPVKSRFVTIVELEPSLEDWTAWAYSEGIPSELIAYIRNRPDLLSDFNPTADLTNSPCPRTWAHAAKIMQLNLPAEVELQVMAGAVGEGAAVEFLQFLRTVKEMPDPDEVLDKPTKIPVPTNMSVLYALCAALAYRANKQTAKSICIYAERLHREGHGEFGALLVKDAYRRDSALANTEAFVRLVEGPLGSLLAGTL